MARHVADRDSFPLKWPVGYPRTEHPANAHFKVTRAAARDFLLDELRRLGVSHVVISTNLPLRQDGNFSGDAAEPADTGVAVYFDLEGKQHVMACDRWNSVRSNTHAIGLSIEALRGLARWGSTDIMNRAFSAFQALPAPAHDWRSVFGIRPGPVDLAAVRIVYRALALSEHPDQGGDHERMSRLNIAMREAEIELGGANWKETLQ